MFDWLIAKLHWVAEQVDPLTGIVPASIPPIHFSDSLIPIDDNKALRDGIDRMMASVPETKKDWHPESNNQVLDIVHPSLYAYTRGRTRRVLPTPYVPTSTGEEESTLDYLAGEILKITGLPKDDEDDMKLTPMVTFMRIGEGQVTRPALSPLRLRKNIFYQPRPFWMRQTTPEPQWQPGDPIPDVVEMNWPSKSDYLWLPSEVYVASADSEEPYKTRFLSYINNLHPDPSLPSGALYPVIERILTKFIPLFEKTLRANQGNYARKEFFNDNRVYWDPPEPEPVDDELITIFNHLEQQQLP
jgi:hypothetical protein